MSCVGWRRATLFSGVLPERPGLPLCTTGVEEDDDSLANSHKFLGTICEYGLIPLGMQMVKKTPAKCPEPQLGMDEEVSSDFFPEEKETFFSRIRLSNNSIGFAMH